MSNQIQARSQTDGKSNASAADRNKNQRKIPNKKAAASKQQPQKVGKKEKIYITVHNEKAVEAKKIQKETKKPVVSQKMFQKVLQSGGKAAGSGGQSKGKGSRQVILP